MPLSSQPACVPNSSAAQLIRHSAILSLGPFCATSAESSKPLPVATERVLVVNSSGFTTSVVQVEVVSPILSPDLATAGLDPVTVPGCSGFTLHTASGSTLNVWSALAKSAEPDE